MSHINPLQSRLNCFYTITAIAANLAAITGIVLGILSILSACHMGIGGLATIGLYGSLGIFLSGIAVFILFIIFTALFFLLKTKSIEALNKKSNSYSEEAEALDESDKIDDEEPFLSPLPNETIQEILGYLQTKDLINVSQVNKHAHENAKEALLYHAKRRGYQGENNQKESMTYLRNRLNAVKFIKKIIPEDDRVLRKRRIPFLKTLDTESTLDKLESDKDSLKKLQPKFNSRLNQAAKTGQKKEVIELLQDFGADVNSQGYLGQTALHWAAQKEDIDLIHQLIRQGADINALTNYGHKTPLFLAVSYGKIYAVQALLEAGADPNIISTVGGNTPLHQAVRHNVLEIGDLLLRAGANINAQNYTGMTPLHLSISLFRTKMPKFLLGLRADPNILDNRGYTSLHTAVSLNSFDLVKLLLAEGANRNLQNNWGHTPETLARGFLGYHSLANYIRDYGN